MDNASSTAIDNLYPALTQCFAIIVCGYFAGRMNLISETEAKGINTFVGTFSLPSLIFMSLAQLDLAAVNWTFLLAVLISKSVVFFSVIVVTVLVGRPLNLARAGIFAIFCTQSNDFAIGYPIVDALYKTTHPDYASYLYLMAPISLAILNPISFIFMEVGNRRSREENQQLLNINSEEQMYKRKLYVVINVIKNIFLNPIIFMTILGVLGNVLFRHKVPYFLGGVLEVLGSAFSASALFLLGLRMVGKVHKLRGPTLVVPGILIMVKLIVLPLVTREVISALHAGFNQTDTVDLSTYGFLYGTFPAAPTVFVFATQYHIDVDLIASAMVACTFISAPLMFVSAKMITITKTDPSEYIKQLDAFNLDISIVGVIACFWVLFMFSLTKKLFKFPHKITACLVVSQFVSCLGAIFWNTINEKNGWIGYTQFALFTIGVYSSRLWTMILAVVLLFLQCKSLCYVVKIEPFFFLVGWGLPLFLTALLLIFDKKTELPFDKRNPNFVYGFPQAVIAVSLLVLCLIVTVGCLILHQRYRRRFARYWDLTNDVATDSPAQHSPGEVETSTSVVGDDAPGPSSLSPVPRHRPCAGGLPTINEGCCEDGSAAVDIEDLAPTKPMNVSEDGSVSYPAKLSCKGSNKTVPCRGIIGQYQQPLDDDLELIEEEDESHQPQILRHTVLLILLLCSMFVALSLSIWTLVMEQMSGIYIELSFLDATLNFGQSIIIFGIFGLDAKEILLPLLKLWRKLWYDVNTLNLPAWHELSEETKHICDQFVTHHLNSCRNSIAEDCRWRLKTYKNVFTGHKFVDWLIDVGLARDRVEAVHYARHLIEGKVLKHINSVYHFYDRNLLYTFV